MRSRSPSSIGRGRFSNNGAPQLSRQQRDMIRLTAQDGHQLDAYVARPPGRARGGVVVVQEMYGLNAYLRSVCEFYASHGYEAIAPALRIETQQVIAIGTGAVDP